MNQTSKLKLLELAMKAFISYSTEEKIYGATVKRVLGEVDIESFLAHDDLHVSQKWAERILAELKQCEIFVPLLSTAFKSSDWCAQEVGVIATRSDVLIMPLSLDGTIPYGFISHIQCHRLPATGLDPLTVLGAVGEKWPSFAIDALLSRVEKSAGSFRAAEKAVEPLVSYFEQFSEEQAAQFAQEAINNGQIWSAALCVEKFLPRFLEVTKSKLPVPLYEKLKYQVENQKWYPDH